MLGKALTLKAKDGGIMPVDEGYHLTPRAGGHAYLVLQPRCVSGEESQKNSTALLGSRFGTGWMPAGRMATGVRMR
jgi:hypothetical protein